MGVLTDMVADLGGLDVVAMLWLAATVVGAVAAKVEKGSCGTFGRLHYLLYGIGGNLVLKVLAWQMTPGLSGDALLYVFFFLALVGGAFHGNITARRVRNIGWNVWWAMLIFVPLVNIGFWLVLVVKPAGRKKTPSSTPTPDIA
ncbi:MAG TPA: hypothetical protein VIN57_00680 [Magnetovibrio sp.]